MSLRQDPIDPVGSKIELSLHMRCNCQLVLIFVEKKISSPHLQYWAPNSWLVGAGTAGSSLTILAAAAAMMTSPRSGLGEGSGLGMEQYNEARISIN